MNIERVIDILQKHLDEHWIDMSDVEEAIEYLSNIKIEEKVCPKCNTDLIWRSKKSWRKMHWICPTCAQMYLEKKEEETE